MGRPTMSAELEHSRPLAAGLYVTTEGRLEYETALSVLGLAFDQCPAGVATNLFVTRKEDRDRARWRRSCRREKTDSFEHEDDVRLHVENAAAVETVTFNTGRIFNTRTDRMNGIGMTEKERAFLVSRKCLDNKVIAASISGDPFDLDVREATAQLDDLIYDHSALFDVV